MTKAAESLSRPLLLQDAGAPLTGANLRDLVAHVATAAASASAAEADPRDSAHDRLFGALMAPFDVMQAERDAYKRVLQRIAQTPPLWPLLLQLAQRQAQAVLQDLELLADGGRGRWQVAGLLLGLSATLRVWLQDESRDLAATMRTLDRVLARLGKAAEWLGLQSIIPNA